MIDILNFTSEELSEYIQQLGEPKFRSNQVFQWLYKGVKSFDDMTNLSKKLREELKSRAYINRVRVEKKLVSKIDGTIKYLFLLEDYNIIEGVVMSYKHGLTACISSQVGCSMGCSFCASTKGGLIRHLKASEMIGQLLAMEEDLGERISNVVIMGSGEPLHNFNEAIRFLHIVNDEKGLNIGNRHITLSTCGLAPEIRKLADLQIPINLAISLHAPTDELRKNLMPIAKRYPITQLMDACRYYLTKNNRRITFEYALIKGVNDEVSHAQQLAKLLRGLLCHINLIPINEVVEGNHKKSNNATVKTFETTLKKNGIETTIRREMGSDINAACGQLRNSHLKNEE
ncbi:23S rRNA (adenine(2503)-C(2))-methyltransferase RlmN [Alkaliphilus serpentinus]|uniref:Probable dual-specificity RNA methyltransferase RlmN n=1 Tax=Alkaliphilus serpentinus TaxID=1482731 RepID=A0A833HRE6_9FIRM|nr:23S rRNA (adenine(2503)-C(2))-methyltransferase RlmN [Alkaliphilus serpentinus]KAB3533136.1 23S rRNA (adenine(2503)-C(2))-methyltransferase RlmN [Alkaliphilus serpentinus]